MAFDSSPSVPAPPPPPPPPEPIDDEEEKARLAAQRKSLEAKRRGRKSLVISPRNPGMAANAFPGLRVPR